MAKYMRCCHIPLDLDESKTVKAETQEFESEIRDAGTTLRTLRDERGWTQEELAKKVKTEASLINEFENGTQPISEELAKKFAKLFIVNYKIFL